MFGLRLGVCLSWSGFNDDAAVPDVDSASFGLCWLLLPLPCFPFSYSFPTYCSLNSFYSVIDCGYCVEAVQAELMQAQRFSGLFRFMWA